MLRTLLQENGIDYEPWSIERLRRARTDSHAVRAEIAPVQLDTLWRRDRLYDVWLDFFAEELRVRPSGER